MTDIEKQILHELGELRTQLQKLSTCVAVLKDRQPTRSRQIARDGGLTVAGGSVVAGLIQLIEVLK